MSMYNKIFTKILDSSIWLETDATRIVWMTLIAAMDEHGFCQFASVNNLAHRAIVDPVKTAEAVKVLESPDADSSDPENEGRRIERVPGGWMVLNAEKYRAIVTRAVQQENTRKRVAKHRAKKHPVTECNADVTPTNASVTPSETETESESEPPSNEQFGATVTREARVVDASGTRGVKEGKGKEGKDNHQMSPEMIAKAVQVEAGIFGVKSLAILTDVCKREMSLHLSPDLIREALVVAWQKHVAAAPALEYTWGAEKFFGEGRWKDEAGWPWKNGKAPRVKLPSLVDQVRQQKGESLAS